MLGMIFMEYMFFLLYNLTCLRDRQEYY